MVYAAKTPLTGVPILRHEPALFWVWNMGHAKDPLEMSDDPSDASLQGGRTETFIEPVRMLRRPASMLLCEDVGGIMCSGWKRF